MNSTQDRELRCLQEKSDEVDEELSKLEQYYQQLKKVRAEVLNSRIYNIWIKLPVIIRHF